MTTPRRRMSGPTFYALCLSLWGEHWRPELGKLLASHGIIRKSRQTFWNWQHGATPVPEKVDEILKAEKRARKRA
jgi:hypothetical protein